MIKHNVSRILAHWPYGYRKVSSVYTKLSQPKVYTPTVDGDIEEYFKAYHISNPELSNPFTYYKDLIGRLLEIDTKLVPLYEFQSSFGNKIVGLRHDIDSNPGVALRMARYLARHGICGSFYLLHTAPYYNHSIMAELVKRFIVAGCEIGLHTDPYQIYMDNGDGAEAVKKELKWLRSQGAIIRGTIGHNSAPAYGCENFEIFEEHMLWDRRVGMPLGVLSEKKLRLSYEGNFPLKKLPATRFPPGEELLSYLEAIDFIADKDNASIRSESWMKKYLNNPCYDRDVDCQLWLIGKDKWAVAGHNLFEWEINLDRVIEIVGNLPEGYRSIITIHPDYFEDD